MPRPFQCFRKNRYICEKAWPHMFLSSEPSTINAITKNLKEKNQAKGTK